MYKKEKILICLLLIASVFMLGVGGGMMGHGASGRKIQSGKVSMHQMKKMPTYRPPEELDKVVHNDITILRLNRKLKDTEDVDKYLAQHKIILLRLEKEQLLPANAERLKNWVKKGGTLWFDDGWSASSYFGVKEEISPSSLLFSREEESIKKDPLTIGVSSLALLNGYFMYPDESFTEVIRQEDRVYLAYKKLGEGMLVYYPSGLTIKLDYYRMQLNLREFSAGFEVPQLCGDEKETHTWDE